MTSENCTLWSNMADCARLSGCPFFQDTLSNMPSMSESYKRKYCRGDHTACARYLVLDALGSQHVSGDLFPNMEERARALIAANER